MVRLKRLVYDARYGKGHGETEELYKGVRANEGGPTLNEWTSRETNAVEMSAICCFTRSSGKRRTIEVKRAVELNGTEKVMGKSFYYEL